MESINRKLQKKDKYRLIRYFIVLKAKHIK